MTHPHADGGTLQRQTRRLALLVSLCLTAAVQGQGMAPMTLVPPGDHPGFPRTFFGIHVHNNPGQPDRWPNIGFGSIRLWDARVSWPQLEPQRGKFDFSRLDHYVDWATSHGVEVLLPLGLSPTWASARPQEPSAYGSQAGSGAGYAAEPADLDDWRAYVRAVVQRYKGRIPYYELWNEVTAQNFFSGTTKDLAKLARATKAIMAEIDPKAKLVAPSSVSLGESQTARPAEFMAEAGRGVADIASFHLYHGAHAPELKLGMAPNVRRQLQLRQFGDVPVWNTETGYNIAPPAALGLKGEEKYRITQEQAAQYLPRDMLLARAMGYERFYWFAWDNDFLGFLEPRTDQMRPHARVLAQFLDSLVGSELKRCTRTSTALWRCDLLGSDSAEIQAVWLEASGGASQQISAPWAGKIQLLDGYSRPEEMGSVISVTPTVALLIRNRK